MHILFDIGGTKTRIAGAKNLVDFGEPIVFATPQEFGAGQEMIVKTIKDLLAGDKLDSIAGGIAGPVDKNTGAILSAPNLPAWTASPLLKNLGEEFGVPVFLYNDTVMAGLGEAVFGAGQKGEIVAYLTVSTGVGGARIVRQTPDETVFGFEPGHQIVDWRSVVPVESGHFGHLDDLVSGKAVESRFGCPPRQITDEKVWSDLTWQFSVGLYNTILHWSPDIVVLGGSMFKSPGLKIDEIRSNLEKMMHIFPDLPQIVPANLGDQGGLYGALAFLQKSK